MKNNIRSRQGSALIVVIVILAMFVVLGMSLIVSTMQETKAQVVKNKSTQAQYIAETMADHFIEYVSSQPVSQVEELYNEMVIKDNDFLILNFNDKDVSYDSDKELYYTQFDFNPATLEESTKEGVEGKKANASSLKGKGIIKIYNEEDGTKPKSFDKFKARAEGFVQRDGEWVGEAIDLYFGKKDGPISESVIYAKKAMYIDEYGGSKHSDGSTVVDVQQSGAKKTAIIGSKIEDIRDPLDSIKGEKDVEWVNYPKVEFPSAKAFEEGLDKTHQDRVVSGSETMNATWWYAPFNRIDGRIPWEKKKGVVTEALNGTMFPHTIARNGLLGTSPLFYLSDGGASVNLDNPASGINSGVYKELRSPATGATWFSLYNDSTKKTNDREVFRHSLTINAGPKGHVTKISVDELTLGQTIYIRGEGRVEVYVKDKINIEKRVAVSTPMIVTDDMRKNALTEADPDKFTVYYAGERDVNFVGTTLYFCMNLICDTADVNIDIRGKVADQYMPKKVFEEYEKILTDLNKLKVRKMQGKEVSDSEIKTLEDRLNKVQYKEGLKENKVYKGQRLINGKIFTNGDINITSGLAIQKGDVGSRLLDMKLFAYTPKGAVNVDVRTKTRFEGNLIGKNVSISPNALLKTTKDLSARDATFLYTPYSAQEFEENFGLKFEDQKFQHVIFKGV